MEQLLEKEDLIIQKNEEIKAITNENELLRDEKAILEQQLNAVKQYMGDLQKRLKEQEEERQMMVEKTPDTEKRMIECNKEIKQLRKHLNQQKGEIEFY